MRTKKRLGAILELVRPCEVAADIGSDHGELAKMLIESGKAKRVIATDISAMSLAKAEALAASLGERGSKIECRVGDGLKPLEGERVDCVIIAGMGGREIVRILSRGTGASQLVLQPMQNAIILRRFLADNFHIDKDFIVKDQKKFYNTFSVSQSRGRKQKLSEIEMNFGLTNFDLRSQDFSDYLDDREARIVKTQLVNPSPKLEKELEQIKKVKQIIKGDKNARDY